MYRAEVVMERDNTSRKTMCIGLRSSWRGITPQVSHVYRAAVVMERGNSSGKAMCIGLWSSWRGTTPQVRRMYREYAKADCLILRIYQYSNKMASMDICNIHLKKINILQ